MESHVIVENSAKIAEGVHTCTGKKRKIVSIIKKIKLPTYTLNFEMFPYSPYSQSFPINCNNAIIVESIVQNGKTSGPIEGVGR